MFLCLTNLFFIRNIRTNNNEPIRQLIVFKIMSDSWADLMVGRKYWTTSINIEDNKPHDVVVNILNFLGREESKKPKGININILIKKSRFLFVINAKLKNRFASFGIEYDLMVIVPLILTSAKTPTHKIIMYTSNRIKKINLICLLLFIDNKKMSGNTPNNINKQIAVAKIFILLE